MGQNMGELKQLENSLINKNNTLTGMTLQPRQILQTLPVGPVPPQPHPQPTAPVQPTQAPQQQVTTITAQAEQQEAALPQDDPNQLLFDFVNDLNTDPSILNIIKKISSNTDYRVSDLNISLKRIEEKVDRLIDLTSTVLKNTSKKKEPLPA